MISGGYLSPEPLLQEPGYVQDMAWEGISVPTYSYAFNNPLYYVDTDGLAGTCSGGRCNTLPGGSGGFIDAAGQAAAANRRRSGCSSNRGRKGGRVRREEGDPGALPEALRILRRFWRRQLAGESAWRESMR